MKKLERKGILKNSNSGKGVMLFLDDLDYACCVSKKMLRKVLDGEKYRTPIFKLPKEEVKE